MSHHTNFQRQVNAATARRRVCPECGGTYRENLRRIWHTPACKRWRTPVSRPDATRYVDADACPHGIEPASVCPGCAEDADRAWKDRAGLPSEVGP